MQTLRLTLATGYALPGDGTANVIPLDLVAGGTLVDWWNPSDPHYITVPPLFTGEGIIGFRCAISPPVIAPTTEQRRWAGVYRNDQVGDITAHHHFRIGKKGPDMISDAAAVTFAAGDRFSLLALQDSGVPLQVVQLAINTVLWVAI